MSHCCPSSLPNSAHSPSCQSLPSLPNPQSLQGVGKVGSIMKLFKFLAKPRLATPLVELIAEEIKTSDETFSREAIDEVLDTLLNSDATLKQIITLYRLMSAKSVKVEAPSQAPTQVAPAQAPVQAPIQAPVQVQALTQAATEPVDKPVENAVAKSASAATATPNQAAFPNPKLLELLRAHQDIEYQIKALQSAQ